MGKSKDEQIKLTRNERKFFAFILKEGNMPDVEIARKTHMSKSTCSRIRNKLERTLISEYVPVVSLHKVGINVFLVLTFQWDAFDNKELTKRTFLKLEGDPRVIFLANGEGSIANTVMFVGLHDIERFHAYLKEFRETYGKYVININTLLLPSKEVIKNDFTEVIRDAIGGK